jgi:DNA-directed RNA polymerase specialized sigma24 family protein
VSDKAPLYLSREWIIVNAIMTEQIGSPKGKRGMDETTFKQFLQWLSEDSHVAGKEYLHIRRLMVTYFTRKACSDPDSLADTTLDRAVGVIAKGDAYATPRALCYGIAKNVWLEYLHLKANKTVPWDETHIPNPVNDTEQQELEARCLEKCLSKLPEARRNLISRYYQGSGKDNVEARKALARDHGGEERLRIKAFRIRKELRRCIDSCIKQSSTV